MCRLHPSRAFGRAAAPILLLALLAGCVRPSAGGPDRAAEPATPVARLETVRPERQTVRRGVGEPGHLLAFETTEVHAKLPGYVREWKVNIGARVEKGRVLAELWVPETEAELAQKRAVVEQAVASRKQTEAALVVAESNVAGSEAKLAEVRAGVARAEADLDRWNSETARVAQLVGERAVTASLLDETRSKLRSAEASLEEVKAQVRTAEVALTQSHAAREQARSDLVAAASAIVVAREDARRVEALLGYSRIEAPFDGVVIRKNVETGQLTRPGADAEPLFVLARSDLVTITIDVPEMFAPALDPGDRAEIKLQAMNGRIVEGKVTRTSWALDPKTRTVRAEIDLPNPGGTLLPGLYVYVTVFVEEHHDVLTVPTTAVVKDKDASCCVVVAGNKAVRQPIRTGLDDGTRTEVVSGLEGGEDVVKANAASLVDGQRVERIEPDPTPARPKS